MPVRGAKQRSPTSCEPAFLTIFHSNPSYLAQLPFGQALMKVVFTCILFWNLDIPALRETSPEVVGDNEILLRFCSFNSRDRGSSEARATSKRTNEKFLFSLRSENTKRTIVITMLMSRCCAQTGDRPRNNGRLTYVYSDQHAFHITRTD